VCKYLYDLASYQFNMPNSSDTLIIAVKQKCEYRFHFANILLSYISQKDNTSSKYSYFSTMSYPT
jgi:hypothetical protein